MAQRHKGPRKQIASLLDPRVRAVMVALAERHTLSVSQYIADLLAAHVGRPDLVRDLRQTTIPYLDDLNVVVDDDRNVGPRVHIDVYQVIAKAAADRGISMSQYVSAVCDAHVAGRELPTANQQEVLLLTSA
ncbi:Uncharacterised protein [Mycobacteroides abscessus subsp. abscessus]|uniref:hypothetical protein n=1 Tax=Mycobacteroides abscessus TaxID=36809 RepID=UPI00092CB951|nr:hypothetical protein [Mycobacteroides abscessus]MBE5502707.1 hypothetical protein [Mycobacteroides abscessus]SIM15785.1 Uncharacterised protein [Mycobacteroides abscessus subsp. abscessus]